MIPGEDRRILEGGSRAEPVSTILILVEVTVHDDEPRTDHVVLAAGGELPLAGAKTAIEFFGGGLAIGTAAEATCIAIAEGARRHQGTAREQAKIRLQRILEFDPRLYVDLLPVDPGAAVFTVARIDPAAAEVDPTGKQRCPACGEIDFALEIAVLKGVARECDVGGQG